MYVRNPELQGVFEKEEDSSYWGNERFTFDGVTISFRQDTDVSGWFVQVTADAARKYRLHEGDKVNNCNLWRC